LLIIKYKFLAVTVTSAPVERFQEVLHVDVDCCPRTMHVFFPEHQNINVKYPSKDPPQFYRLVEGVCQKLTSYVTKNIQ